MVITPGVRFLFVLGLNWIIQISAVSLVLWYLNLEGQLPVWSVVLLATAFVPLCSIVKVPIADYRNRRRAAALGARVVPQMKGGLPGNLDILRFMIRSWRTGYPSDAFVSALESLGPVFDVKILGESQILTTCPEHIQIILATEFNNFEKGANFQKCMGSVLGTGVFNADGEMWKFHRTMTRPFFTRDRITHFDTFDRNAETMIKKMKQRFREGYSLDFQDLISRFTLDSATEFLFGSSVGSLHASLPYPTSVTLLSPTCQSAEAVRANEFSRAFLEAQEQIALRERLGWIWPLQEMFGDKTVALMKIISSFIEPIIKEAVERKHLSRVKKDDIQEDETLLDHLVQLTSDPVILKDEILNIMLAGRDTTAGTLTFVVYFLATYPHVMARLRQEVLAHVGHTKRPSVEEIKEMKYLRAVINETLRLYPVVPFNIRTSINETVFPSPDPTQKPLYIPPRTKVPYSVFLMQRRKDLWGPDAEEFDPDRFLDERVKKYLTPRPFIFLPFNAGPRICLGQQFAYNEMSFMLIRLVQNFSSFSLDMNSCPPEFWAPREWAEQPELGMRRSIDKFFPKISLTMYSAGGLWVKAAESTEVADS